MAGNAGVPVGVKDPYRIEDATPYEWGWLSFTEFVASEHADNSLDTMWHRTMQAYMFK